MESQVLGGAVQAIAASTRRTPPINGAIHENAPLIDNLDFLSATRMPNDPSHATAVNNGTSWCTLDSVSVTIHTKTPISVAAFNNRIRKSSSGRRPFR